MPSAVFPWRLLVPLKSNGQQAFSMLLNDNKSQPNYYDMSAPSELKMEMSFFSSPDLENWTQVKGEAAGEDTNGTIALIGKSDADDAYINKLNEAKTKGGHYFLANDKKINFKFRLPMEWHITMNEDMLNSSAPKYYQARFVITGTNGDIINKDSENKGYNQNKIVYSSTFFHLGKH